MTAGPIVLAVIFVLLYHYRNVFDMRNKATRLFCIGLAVYIFGAFILESTGSFLIEHKLELIGKTEIILEEACEMFGIILIIKGLMEYRRDISNVEQVRDRDTCLQPQ